MSLSPGTRLGPYEILAPIGAGGMGEVYRARDPRLNRDVAIKVSVAQFSERFEREAKAIAALNHPNICQIYDVGPDFLVMEYVEGKPLQGPVPLKEALTLAGQILDGLDAAHRKGITHRDLKPGNILVGKEGVKVLDFGLAKFERAHVPDDLIETRPLTNEGAILGTLQYMSPEQVEGREADARSDIFAFGLVLFELITGKPAFESKSKASLIASILKEQPRPLKDLQPLTPPALERVVQTCLEKDPDKRWQSAREVRHALEWISAEPQPAPAPPPKSKILQIAGGATVLIALVALIAWWRTHPAEQPLKPMVRLDVDLGPDVSLGGAVQGGAAGAGAVVSPDGSQLVYVSQGRLFVRQLNQTSATELQGTQGGGTAFFSPDGQWVAFFAQGKLKKVPLAGGAVTELCGAPTARGGTWGEDGNIIASLTSAGGLWRVPAAGGKPTPATELTEGEVTQRFPQLLPGGKAVLFTSHTGVTGFDGAKIEVLSFADHRRKTLVQGGSFARYLPTGHLLYVNRGTLFGVRLDLKRMEVRGTAVPLLQDVAYSNQFGVAQFDISNSGTLVYQTARSESEMRTIQWLDQSGQMKPLLAKPGIYSGPKISPDGQRLALYTSDGANSDIWNYEWLRDVLTRLTFGTSSVSPIWSADGRYIVFQTQGTGMFWIRADGSGKPQPLTKSKNQQFPDSFAPDGKWLSFHEETVDTGNDIWTLPLENNRDGLRAGKPEQFLQTPFNEGVSNFSPDGRWLAYTSNESGRDQVYVRTFPDKGTKWQISNGGGEGPVWSRRRNELFFRGPDNRMMVATYAVKEDSFIAEKPQVWSERRIGAGPSYDISTDGKRFAVIMPVEPENVQQPQNHITFLMNFSDELRRRVPAGSKN
jgi:eukaryotic-like serine/threonine-protein kinase